MRNETKFRASLYNPRGMGVLYDPRGAGLIEDKQILYITIRSHKILDITIRRAKYLT